LLGATASGKTESLKSLIYQISLADIENNISFILYTPKTDLDDFQYLDQLRYPIIKEIPDIDQVLAATVTEMERRSRIRIKGAPIMVVIDELTSLLSRSDKATFLIERLCERGRSERITCILATQSGKKTVFGNSDVIRENITTRLCFRTHNKRESNTISGNSEIHCEKLQCGEAYLISSNRWKRLNTPLCDVIERLPEIIGSDSPLQLIGGGLEAIDPGDRNVEDIKGGYEEREKILALPEKLRLEIRSLDGISKTKIVSLLSISNNKACELLSLLDDLKLLLPKKSPTRPSPINKARLKELEERYPDLFGIKTSIPKDIGI